MIASPTTTTTTTHLNPPTPLQSFPELRNPSPSPGVLAKARRGNLVALGLIRDPAPPRGKAAGGGSSRAASLGANAAWRDEATLPEFSRAAIAAHRCVLACGVHRVRAPRAVP